MRSRQRILDATVDLIQTGGFGAVNISIVATAAGVSRQTVYSIFGSREELVSQAMLGLAGDTMDAVRAHVAGVEDAADYVVELILVSRRLFRANPVFTALVTGGEGNPFFDAGMMQRAKPAVAQMLVPLAERDPQVAKELDDLVELVTRLVVSVVLFESEHLATEDDLRRFVVRWVRPALP